MPPAIGIAAIGECMIELSDPADGRPSLAFGGDTLNTAVYLARLAPIHGAGVDYLTALGDDPYSEAMVAFWYGEGIGTAHVARLPGRLPGLYAIRTDAAGERSFYYWRSASAARDMLQGDTGTRLVAALPAFRLVYLSGITLSILDQPSRDRLVAAIAAARAAGATIAFDSNYRPRGWASAAAARAAMDAVLAHVDIALPGLDDERALRGVATTEDCAAALADLGVGEVCVKDGVLACLARHGTERHTAAPPMPLQPVDTTAAGDSFNAAYLAMRLAGAGLPAALAAGHRLAAAVIGHRGAIIPRAAMPDLKAA